MQICSQPKQCKRSLREGIWKTHAHGVHEKIVHLKKILDHFIRNEITVGERIEGPVSVWQVHGSRESFQIFYLLKAEIKPRGRRDRVRVSSGSHHHNIQADGVGDRQMGFRKRVSARVASQVLFASTEGPERLLCCTSPHSSDGTQKKMMCARLLRNGQTRGNELNDPCGERGHVQDEGAERELKDLWAAKNSHGFDSRKMYPAVEPGLTPGRRVFTQSSIGMSKGGKGERLQEEDTSV
ncbi:hypothetical protein C8R43DRAFT_958463 [Mycena crocata]|nr:hypothetical protein C8R43DRAFT_958463 [Mycena crocata]